ncbi:MAG: VIT domain-containing protein [Phycisphaerae bacterium]
MNDRKPETPHEETADKNLRNLLGKAYDPPSPSPVFGRELTDRLIRRATEKDRGHGAEVPRRAWLWIPAAAAACALLALGGWWLANLRRAGEPDTPGKTVSRKTAQTDANADANAAQPLRRPALHAFRIPADEADKRKTLELRAGRVPLDAPADPPLPALELGQRVETGRGEKRLLTLPDGSTLMVNQESALVLQADRQIRLLRGEVYLEVPRRGDGDAAETFTVRTPRRQVTALGTHFGVSSDPDGRTHVLVTQGKVRVEGLERFLTAGEIASAAEDTVRVRRLPRSAVALDWTRQLVARANTPLVPQSKHAGGRLIAKADDGGEAPLSLRKIHVDVHIEDGFARTTIVQTYFNHLHRRTEGTFLFPLPADASLSRLAMYVAGKRMEGGMVTRERGREVYDDIVTSLKDPALLEWVDGTTFRMRVFPLEPREEKVILLSYTQCLDEEYGRQSYRFPAGHSLGKVREWSCNIHLPEAETRWNCLSHELTETRDPNGGVSLTATARDIEPSRDIVLTLTPRDAVWDKGEDIPEQTDVRTSREGERRYLMVRHRPRLAADARSRKRHWVFVQETSAARNPLLARAQIELMRGILHYAAAGDTFQVITAAHRAKLLTPDPLAVGRQTVEAVAAALGKTHLLGGLDAEAALKLAARTAEGRRDACIVYLGAGQPVLGERSNWELVEMLSPRVRFVGLATGKRYNSELLNLAARRTNGLHLQVNPDENLRWRAREILDTLNTPRITALEAFARVDGERRRLLLTDTMVSHGGQARAILAIGEDAELPGEITFHGVLAGRPWSRTVSTAGHRGGAGYLPRTWAKLEIERLQRIYARTRDEPIREKITQLSLEMYVMCPWTSLIVLENPRMYRDYGVEQGRSDHWAMYPAPPTIPVVYEPLESPRPQADPRRIVGTEEPVDSWRRRLLGTIRTHELLTGEMLLGNARELLADGQLLRARDLLAEARELGISDVEVDELHRWLSAALEVSGQAGAPRPIVPGMGNRPWYKLIRYPSSFAHQAQRRKRKSIGRFAEPAAERRTRRKLRVRIHKVGFQDIPLEHVIEFLRDVAGVNVVVNWARLEDRGLEKSTEISLEELKDITAEQLLELVLDASGRRACELNYEVRNNVVYISTESHLRTRTYQRVYDIRGLVPEQVPMPDDLPPIVTAADSRVARRRLEQIVGLLKNAGPVDSWADQGGAGTIREYPGLLLVRHTPEVHEKIEQLLTMLRYPDDWPRRLQLLRQKGLRDIGSISAEEKFRRAIHRPITLDKQVKTTMGEFIRFVKDNLGENLVVDWQAMANEGVHKQTPLEMPGMKDVSLKEVVKIAGESLPGPDFPLTLGYRHGVLHMAPRRKVLSREATLRAYDIRDLIAPTPYCPRPKEDPEPDGLCGDDDDDEIEWIRAPAPLPDTRVTDVTDLLIPVPDFNAPTTDLNDLPPEDGGFDGLFSDDDDDWGPHSTTERLVTSVKELAPLDVWHDQGGPGSVEIMGGRMVVRANDRTHRNIRKMMDLLRRAYRPSPTGPTVIRAEAGTLASLTLSEEHFDRPTLLAAGFITTEADVAAVLEAEGPAGIQPRKGRIDSGAADLLKIARRNARSSDGWTRARRKGETVDFHPDGRYGISRTAGAGLTETLFCDGNALWHVYPELGLVARREMSRFHRIAAMVDVPWIVPSADLLATGADVRLVAPGVLAVVPHRNTAARQPALRLTFDDGRLIRREWLDSQGRRLRGIETAADGTVRELGPAGRRTLRGRYAFTDASEPRPPSLQRMVVLEMPVRSPRHVLESRNLDETDWEKWTPRDALAFVAATMLPPRSQWTHRGSELIRERFFARKDHRPGLYVLAMAAEKPVDVKGPPRNDIQRYITADTLPVEEWDDPSGFLKRLADIRRLYRQVQQERPADKPKAEWMKETLATLKEMEPNVLTWAIASELILRKPPAELLPALVKLLDRHAETLPEVRMAAGYSAARCLAEMGRSGEAAGRFVRLIAAMAEHRIAPVVDKQIRGTMDIEAWSAALRSASEMLNDANAVAPSLLLGWNAIRAGDREGGLAVLRSTAQRASGVEKKLAAMGAFEICISLHEWDLAEEMVPFIEGVPLVAESSDFWRMAATVAYEQGEVTKHALRMANALEADYAAGEPMSYEPFLKQHRITMDSLVLAARQCRREGLRNRKLLATKIVRIADHSRVIFRGANDKVLLAAAEALLLLEAEELAWGYLTTPVARSPMSHPRWSDLSKWLAEHGRISMAADAKVIEAEWDFNCLRVAWEACDLLEQAGREKEAIEVCRQALTRKGLENWDRDYVEDIADALSRLTGEKVELPEHLRPKEDDE